MKKLLGLLIIFCTASLTFYYLQQKPQSTNTDNKNFENIVVVGTSADYPPYEKIDLATGKIVGFDIDVITEVARRIGKRIELKDMPFNSLMLNLAAGRIDVVAAGLSETPERREAVLFSDIYLDSDYMVIVTPSYMPPLREITDLYGKTVAVNTGYNADSYLSTMPQIKLIRLDSTADSILALQAKSVDAFATSKSSYRMFIEQHGNAQGYQYFEIPHTAEQCAFALAKHNKELQKQITNALQSMYHDGTLQTIQKKWGFYD